MEWTQGFGKKIYTLYTPFFLIKQHTLYLNTLYAMFELEKLQCSSSVQQNNFPIKWNT